MKGVEPSQRVSFATQDPNANVHSPNLSSIIVGLATACEGKYYCQAIPRLPVLFSTGDQTRSLTRRVEGSIWGYSTMWG